MHRANACPHDETKLRNERVTKNFEANATTATQTSHSQPGCNGGKIKYTARRVTNQLDVRTRPHAAVRSLHRTYKHMHTHNTSTATRRLLAHIPHKSSTHDASHSSIEALWTPPLLCFYQPVIPFNRLLHPNNLHRAI